MRVAAVALAALALPAAAFAVQQTAPAAAPAEMPGRPDPSRVQAGRYVADTGHTQVLFKVSHFGISDYTGLFGGATGTLDIDPARPGAASVNITIPIDQVRTTSEQLDAHLKRDDFFDAANHPNATFRSTRVTVDGTNARIEGELTMRGVTRPATIDAQLTGAGTNPMNQKASVGFEGMTRVRRSEFGIDYAVPMVSDEVQLWITAAFERE